MRRVVLIAFAFICAPALALGPEKACFQKGTGSEKTCAISLSTLIARGEDFDGKIVAIRGFFAYAEKPMLFVSRDAFLTSDTPGGVVVQMPANATLARKLAGADHQYVMIVGRYHALASDLTAYPGGLLSGGYITEITSAGAVGDQPWGYSVPAPYEDRRNSSP
jgi:hypothetical protein